MEKLLKWYKGLDATKKRVLILAAVFFVLIIVGIILPKLKKKESYVQKNISNSNVSVVKIEKVDSPKKALNKEEANVISKNENLSKTGSIENAEKTVERLNSLSVKSKEEEPVESKKEKEIAIDLKDYGRSDPYKPLVKKLVEESPQPIKGIPPLLLPTSIKPPFLLLPAGIKPPPLPQEMEREDFRLTGILWDEEPLAIIEGEGVNAVVGEGDYVKDYVVDKVERKKVILKKGNKKIVLRLGG